MIAVEIIGWTGTALLVLAYALVSAKGRTPGLRFQVLNGLGALALVVNGAFHGAWPSVGLNIVWFGIAVVSIVGLLRRRATEKEHGDESRSAT